MLQLSSVKMLSYIERMLPELIWVGLIYDRMGVVPGNRLFEQLVRASFRIRNPVGESQANAVNFAVASCYSSLGEADRNLILEHLADNGALAPLQECLSPLTALFEDFPLGFIGLPPNLRDREALVGVLRESIDSHGDKYASPAILLHGAMLVARLVTGTIHFPADMDLPDFNAVVDDPDSEAARRAAGFMRANALGEFGMLDVDPHWANRFWNTCYELEPCDLSESESSDS